MRTIIKSAKYLRGYFRRPYLWRDLLRQPFRWAVLCRSREATAAAATEWALSKAISTQEAIKAICGQGQTESFREKHPDLVNGAKLRTERCPVRLGAAGDLDLLYALTLHLIPKVAIETGVAYGWSSLAILQALKENGVGRLVSIDRPDMQLLDDVYVGCAVPPELRNGWELIFGVDRDRLPSELASAKKIQLFHYDSDKSYFGKAWALKHIWNALDVGGVLVCDDICNNTAFMDFCSSVSVMPIVARNKTHLAGILIKV